MGKGIFGVTWIILTCCSFVRDEAQKAVYAVPLRIPASPEDLHYMGQFLQGKTARGLNI